LGKNGKTTLTIPARVSGGGGGVSLKTRKAINRDQEH
jgi:hypothetical protein